MRGELPTCQGCGYPMHTNEHAPDCAMQTIESEKASMDRLKDVMDPADYEMLVDVLGNEEGNLDQIFDPKDTLMHTTNSEVFERMLESGVINTEGETQKTPGASFTVGNFPEAISFQLIYDNMSNGGREKMLSSEKYQEVLGGTLQESFVRYFWENHEDLAKEFIGALIEKIPEAERERIGVRVGEPLTTLEEAIAVGTFFNPRKREGFGVTIVYDEEKSDSLDVSDSTTAGLQRFFEKRSFHQGGVPLSEASVILVPQQRIEEIRAKLKKQGIDHVEVRASEELDARRLVEKAPLLQ